MPRTTRRPRRFGPEADAIEDLYARGVTDGLPVVPPTLPRVEQAITASGRAAGELIALVPPGYGRATVEKIAVNAVMAGCRPEYLPVVIAGVEAMCDEAFDLLGISGTTDAVAPLFVINGPIRKTLDINSGVGVFGPGWRANATIGRALRLIWVNVGGAKPGIISMSTFGSPGRYTYCIGENEEESSWEPLHVEHGFKRAESTVAALAAEAPLVISAAAARTARQVVEAIVPGLRVVGNPAATALGDVLILFSPEHARTIAGDGWSKAQVRHFLWERLRDPAPKFRAPENLKLAVAGGTAGRFTAMLPSWPFPNAPTGLVIKKIRFPPRRGARRALWGARRSG